MSRLLIGLVIGLTGIRAQDISIRSFTDNTVIGLNQQFTLNVELSGEGVNSAGEPELPDMGSFARFLGSGSSQNIQVVNGRMSVSKILTYHFQATSEGKFRIGPVNLKAGGKTVSTDPIDIEIKAVQGGRPQASPQAQTRAQSGANDSGDDLFVEAIPDKKRVFQNEPVTITYKIYTRLQVTSFGFVKEPETTGFWKEDFELPPQPVTSTEVVNGKQYTVAVIKKQSLFPMSPGSKKIDPLVIQCEVRSRRRSRDPFGDFFSDPFFGRTESMNVPSNTVNIQVLPLPDENKPADFNGAVGRLSLKADVDKRDVRTNEAVTYTIRIEGRGNIHVLPDPKVNFSSDFEVYPPKIKESVQRKSAPVSGSKTYEYILVPRFPGTQQIDPVRLSYFDPDLKAYKVLQTDPIQIRVEQGDEPFALIPPGATKEQVKWRGKDIRFIKTETAVFRKTGASMLNMVFFWTVLLIPLAGLSAAYGMNRHLNRIQGDMAYARDRRAGRMAKKHLKKAASLIGSGQDAGAQKAFYAEAGHAVMGFLGDKLNMAKAGLISEEVRSVLENRGVGADTIASVFSILQTCDFQRFAPSDTSKEDMQAFLKRTERVLVQLDRELRK
ncbi:protein BatD [bacterium]|nr:protein BatD [bacterium]